MAVDDCAPADRRTWRFVFDTSNQFLRRTLPPALGSHRVLIEPLRDRVARRAGCDRDPLAWAVIQQQADFGIWIDGHGERCRLVDEGGGDVPPEMLTALLASTFAANVHPPVVVVEPATPHPVVALLKRIARVRRGHARCEPMFTRMQETGAVLGGGPSGRLWFADPIPAMDAGRALRLLLEMLPPDGDTLSSLLDRLRQQAYDRA